MNSELQIEIEMKAAFAAFLAKGFSYRYFYEKGGDSSCVYIYRFQKGKDFFDLREVSGGEELNFVVYSRGGYQFPLLKRLYPKEFSAFKRRHFFRRATKEEKRAFYALLLTKRLEEGGDFFGIAIG